MQKLFEAYGYPPASLYPLLRLVLPHLDNTRPNYNMKQAQLAKAVRRHAGSRRRRSTRGR